MKRLFRNFLLAAASFGPANAAASKHAMKPAPPMPMFDFQGSTLGDELVTWQAAHPDIHCASGKLPGETECDGEKPAFISTWGKAYYYFYRTDPQAPSLLYDIEIIASPNEFSTINDGLKGKWGDPTTGTSLLSIWKRPGSTLTYLRRYNGLSVHYLYDAVNDAHTNAKRNAAAKVF